MNDQTDSQLLRAYAESRSESAFAELARRHVDLVYSAARRMVCDSHLAEDVTQGVFVALAKNAGQLTDRPVLSGWLHRTAQNIAAQTVRTDVRRRVREQEAVAMNELLSGDSEASWDEIAPYLDVGLGELSEPDRDAILLRYFERKSAREMAQRLSISEDAAQKRVNRAVDRLREIFSKRGVAIGTSGLVVVISANAVQAAPFGLITTISATSALVAANFQTSTLTATTKTLSMTALQKTLITATVAVLAGVGMYEARRVVDLRDEVQSLRQKQAPLTEQIRQLQVARDAAERRAAAQADQFAKANSNKSELMKLRGEVGRLRENAAEAKQDPAYIAWKEGQERINKIKQRLVEMPAAKIPEMRFLTEADYWDATRFRPLDCEESFLAALSNLRSHSEFAFITKFLNPALVQYAKANGGRFPENVAQLQPYFPSPVEDSILSRWMVAPAQTVRTDDFGDMIITTRAAVDEDFDPRYAVGLKGFASAGRDTESRNAWGVPKPDIVLGPSLKAAFEAFKSANHGQEPRELAQLSPYLTLSTPELQAAYQKMLKWSQKR